MPRALWKSPINFGLVNIQLISISGRSTRWIQTEQQKER
jgi:hypothetical protein